MASEAREIEPPWVQYPGYGPGDTFWRQTGQAYLSLVWRPYYDALGAAEQERYLQRWQVPEVWWKFYLDPQFQAWLESTDEL